MIIKKAIPTEYESVKQFYYDLIDAMQNSTYHPKWQKGIYPEDQYIQESISNGSMYIGLLDSQIVSAAIINHASNDGYQNVDWPTQASENEVAVIHALGVTPCFARRGIGKNLVTYLIRVAKAKGCKVIRLDVLEGNLPAEKLYKSCGFQFVKRVELYYEDTGLVNFDLYELKL